MINACDILKKLVKTFDVPIEIKSTIEYFSTLSLNTYKKFYEVFCHISMWYHMRDNEWGLGSSSVERTPILSFIINFLLPYVRIFVPYWTGLLIYHFWHLGLYRIMSYFFAKCLALVVIIGIRFVFSIFKFAYLDGLSTL